MITQIDGNIITESKTGNYTYLAHGCNCFCRMKSGVAKSIVENYPLAEKADLSTRVGDESKLGRYSVAKYPNITILNCYTQFKYGTDSRKVNYEALYCCFEKINNIMTPSDKLLIPKIGCGLAGGNWTIVSTIIGTLLKDKYVTFVNYDAI